LRGEVGLMGPPGRPGEPGLAVSICLITHREYSWTLYAKKKKSY
jgi:hypothetical protein